MYNQCLSIVGYNEHKVQKGTAELIESNLFGEGKEEYIEVLNDTVALNGKVKDNKFFQIVLSAAVNDSLSNDVFKSFASEYINEMGYGDCPFLIYRHHDTSNNHIHIVGSTVNYEGKKIKEAQLINVNGKPKLEGNYQRSVKILSILEKKYNLQLTQKDAGQSKNLTEINQDKYRYQRSIKHALETEFLSFQLSKIPQMPKVIETLKNRDLSNYQVKKEIGGEGNFKLLHKFLAENQILETSKKEVLKAKLDHLLKGKPTFEEFSILLDKNNIYSRKLFNGENQYVVYGDKVTNFYSTDQKLGNAYLLSSIDQAAALQKPIREREDQRKFLLSNVTKALAQSKTIDDFRLNLQSRNIDVVFSKNSGGIYGVTFKSLAIANPIDFKGSELHKTLSFKNIQTNLAINLSKLNENSFKQENSTSNSIAPETSKPISLKKLGRAFDDDDEDRKGKNKGNEPAI